MRLRYVVADVFTDRPLAGNQLAVFTDGREVDDENRVDAEHAGDAVLVLPKEKSQDVRKVVEALKAKKLDRFL